MTNAPFDPSYQQAAEEPRTSALAIWSLICSIVLCCPVTTILGVLLGIGAFLSISSNPAKRGKGLAVTGILLGVIFTTGQAIIYPMVVKPFVELVQESMALVTTTAPETITLGASGQYDAFRAEMYGAAATATDDEIKAFFDEVERRYGSIQGCTFDEAGQTQQQFGQPSATMPYVIDCADGPVNAEIELVFADQNTGQFIMKVGSIVVDPTGDRLTFPGGPADGGGDAAPGDSG